ncbi:MAG: hypothetical protein WBQ14_08930 [Gaiellaceae bacterium]
METVTRNGAERSSGPAFAGIIAAGLAFAALGVVTTLAEVFDGFGDWLAFSGRVGMLSGETILAIAVYIVSWAGLGLFWRRSDPPLVPVAVVTVALVAVGLLGTFPPFFRLFGVEE